MKFKSIADAEDFYNIAYANKFVQVNLQDGNEFVGKIDRISIDVATKTVPLIILIFPEKRIEIEKDDFQDTVKLLN